MITSAAFAVTSSETTPVTLFASSGYCSTFRAQRNDTWCSNYAEPQ